MLMPRELNGGELPPVAMLAVLEELAMADASAAWIVMIGSTSGLSSAFVAEDIAREVFVAAPGGMTAGVVAPLGTAVRIEGGYRVSGRWPFASGCEHSEWIALNCMVEGGGPPMMFFALVRRDQIEIIDTWDVSGLRATGSHDVRVTDAFVPDGYGYSLGIAQPLHEGSLYRFSVLGLLSAAVAGVALGIGRGALDDFRVLAGAKTPTGKRKALVEWGVAQSQYAEAEAALRSGRAFLIEAIDTAWRTLERGDQPADPERALIRLAASTAVQGAAKAVDTAYNLAGGSAIYSKHTLQRRFRDIHTLTAHVMIGPSSFEAAGRALLGLTVAPGFL